VQPAKPVGCEDRKLNHRVGASRSCDFSHHKSPLQ
jgi:hypothetical protein